MRDKLIPILNLCVSFFLILYAAFIYKTTYDITLVTIVLLAACLVPVLHVVWNYVKIKFEEYEEQHSHHYHRG